MISGADANIDIRTIAITVSKLKEEARALNMFDIDRFLISPAFKSRFSISERGEIRMNA